MRTFQTRPRTNSLTWRHFGLGILVTLSTCAFVAVAGAAGHEDEGARDSGVAGEILGALKESKPILDVNLRWEYGKIDAFQHSHGATARTRFGVKSGSAFGFSGLIEGVNTASPKPSAYFDGVETNDGPQTIVADPERTDVNRVWLAYRNADLGGLEIKAGRQRIKLDDDRWIGNVGWRQNEQTFDSVRATTNLGMPDLRLQYVYVWQVNRIFGDQGPAGTRDFGPRAHFVNVAYDAGPAMKAVFFAYLVDPNQANFRAFGSATYGARFTGSIALSDAVSMPYQASYAFQEDWGNNQVSYDAHYALAETGLALKDCVKFFVGYEHLGSDTDARIVTPFSTAHKFNGFADAFLTNGGTRGLRDLYARIAPAIPIDGVKLSFAFHQFWDDQGGDDLGQEYDVLATWKLNDHVGFLWKFAYFDGGKKPTTSKRTRSILQTTFRF